jgi:ABC-2 type transport system ATP-binding protein
VNGAPLAVAVRGLTKRFGSVVALDGLDLDVPAGSSVGIVGPTAAGKSTLLRILAGLARPSKGSVTVAEPGEATPLRGTEARRRIGYLPPAPGLYEWMSGRELLEMLGGLLGLTGDELRERTDAVLGAVELEDDADERIATYGPAARQRLAFGQAVMARPGLLLLDEPLAKLDRASRADLATRITELRGTTTVVLATASLDDAIELCDRIAVVDQGQVVAAGGIDELMGRVTNSAYLVDVEAGDEAGVVLLAEVLRRQAWVRDVAIDGTRIRIGIADPELAALRIAPILGTSGLRIRGVERAPVTLDQLLAAVDRTDPADADVTAPGGAAAEAAR